MEEHLGIEKHGDLADDIAKFAGGPGDHNVVSARGQAPYMHDLRVLDNLHSAWLARFRFARVQQLGEVEKVLSTEKHFPARCIDNRTGDNLVGTHLDVGIR
jgi:hypothetical protein